MSDPDRLRAAEATLNAIEAALERAIEAADLDLDLTRQGNVITLEFGDGSKLVLNSHLVAGELWVAARSGGFHYRLDGERWVDGRSGDELWAALSRLVSQQSGQPVVLARG